MSYIRTPEHRAKMSQAIKEWLGSLKQHHRVGSHHSEVTRLKMSKSSKAYYKKHGRWWRPTVSPEERRAISMRNFEMHKKMPWLREGLIARNKNGPSRSTREKIGEASKRFHSSLSLREKKAWFKRLFSENKPNGSENALAVFLRSKSLPYKYVGDGQVWIAKKNPDFININGKKEVIELLGCYWHGCKKHCKKVFRADDSMKLKNHYKKFGFDCKIIWQHDLADESKLSRILG